MAHEELLKTFNDLVDQYQRHRDYIDKAKAQAEKFSKAVIEKVILDHEVKSSTVADRILPHVPTILEGIGAIDAEKNRINLDKAGSDEKMEELNLRLAIGEMEQDAFDEESRELRETLDSAAGRIETLDLERSSLQGAIDRWVALAISAGQADGVPAEDVTIAGSDLSEDLFETAAPAQVPVVEDSPRVEVASVSGMREDVSAVFEDSPAATAVAAQDEESMIEAADAEPSGDEPSADVDFGFDDDGDDFLADNEGAEVQLDLVEEAPAHKDSDDEIGVDLGSDDALGDNAPAGGEEGEEQRRALLLYQEGTAEEQIYPFTGEVLTIGRGRDNDIQIKNDSKVSRFHCRLFRRGGNFYIEDNKSSNGTLVNGELITERRLFGGEEVIIGETFFRFRIM